MRGMISRIEELKRFKNILNTLLKYEWDPILHKLHLQHLIPKNRRNRKGKKKFFQPRRLRLILEELGGTFVKLGQLLSLRPDLLPKEYIIELGKLQDQVKPVSYREIKKIVESDLHAPIDALFSSFTKKPISSASVSQVHEATLVDGSRMAVKVQRPNIRRLFEEDISILKHLAHLLEQNKDIKVISPKQFVEEFEQYTLQELNFKEEARNIESFHSNFEDDPITKIPAVHWELTSKRVLTMEFIDGIPIRDRQRLISQGTDPRAVAVNLAHSIYTQILIFGEFHADPHPGNVFALKDHRIALLDMGIVGKFSPESKKAIRTVFFSILTKDLEGMVNGMQKLSFFSPGTDVRQFQKDIRQHLRQFYNVSVEDIKLTDFLHEVLYIMRNNQIKIPIDLVLLVKTLITLDGTCRILDPNFNPITSGKSFLKVLSKHERDPRIIVKGILRETMRLKNFIVNIPGQAQEIVSTFRKADEYMASLNKSVRVLTIEMDRSTSRLSEAMIISGLLIASSFLIDVEFYPLYGMSVFSILGFGLAGILILQLFISSLLERRFIQKLFNQRIFKRP